MTTQLFALSCDAHDPHLLARFWAGVLRREIADDGTTLLPSADTEFRIRFLPTLDPKDGPNQVHIHLTSTSSEDLQQTVERAVAFGGRHLDVGQLPDEEHVVLADPEGNEFCVIPPGNSFLADCGFLAELACDGTREVGHFWSEVLGWPLVWDQDQETAIQSPSGGTKIAWGGPPVRPKTGRNRLHFDLAPPGDADQQAEVQRLTSLGATRIGREHEPGSVAMADPDGNEFCLVAGRPGCPTGRADASR